MRFDQKNILINKLSVCSGHTGIAGGQRLDLNFEKILSTNPQIEDIKNEIPSNNNTVFAIQRKVFSRSNISLLMINRESMKSYSFLTNTEKYNRLLGIDYNLASKNNE